MLGAALAAQTNHPPAKVPEPPAEQKPWRLSDRLGGPSWLKISGEQRTRHLQFFAHTRQALWGDLRRVLVFDRMRTQRAFALPCVGKRRCTFIQFGKQIALCSTGRFAFRWLHRTLRRRGNDRVPTHARTDRARRPSGPPRVRVMWTPAASSIGTARVATDKAAASRASPRGRRPSHPARARRRVRPSPAWATVTVRAASPRPASPAACRAATGSGADEILKRRSVRAGGAPCPQGDSGCWRALPAR